MKIYIYLLLTSIIIIESSAQNLEAYCKKKEKLARLRPAKKEEVKKEVTDAEEDTT